MSKVIDINDRVPSRKRRRKIRTNIKFSIIILLFLISIAALFYYQSDYSKVQTIQVSGNEYLDDSTYIDLSAIELNESMWDFKIDKTVERLKKNDWVKSVEITRNLLTTVSIKIEEWPKVAYVEENGHIYPMLENGAIFKEVEFNEPITGPLFIGFENEKIRKKIVKEVAKLNPEILELISQVNLNPTESDPYAIILYMNDGYEVRAEISSFAEKLNYYPSIVALIEQEEDYEKGIIDLEVGSYYRPYSGEYQSISVGTEEMDQNGEENE